MSVGYLSQPVEQAGGAVASAAAADLRTVRAARFEDLLESRFAGVHVIRAADGGISVQIGSVSRLSGSQDPLYVIDGFPVEVTPGRGLDWLNPADVERIDVLRGAAETSLYGVRGANGVIVITTKR